MTEETFDATEFEELMVYDAFEHAQRAEDDEPDQQDPSLFEGDTGTLHEDQRRVLHVLLKRRYLSADKDGREWATLLHHEDLISSRLNDLFLQLHIDRDRQVAFKRQAITPTGEPLPTLLRTVPHTKEETIVMLHLRQKRFAQRQESYDDVYVERESLLREIEQLRPESLTNRSAARSHSEKAIESLQKAGVLLRTPDKDRFAISPIIEVLLPVERLQTLWDWLSAQNGTASSDEYQADEGDLDPEIEEEDDDE